MLTTPPRLSPPPRSVPLSLAITVLFNGGVQLGMVVFSFAMIFFWVFAMNGDYSVLTTWGPRERAEGIVQRIEATGASENESPVIAHHYQFMAGAQQWNGISYSSDRSVAAGERVTVEYLRSSPAESRIDGMRAAMFGPVVGIVVVFPLIVALFVLFAAKVGATRLALLRHGVVATGARQGDAPVRKGVESFAAILNVSGRQLQQMQPTLQKLDRTPDAAKFTIYDPQQSERTHSFERSQVDDAGELIGQPAAAVRAFLAVALLVTLNALPILSRLGIDWSGSVKSAIKATLDQWPQ